MSPGQDPNSKEFFSRQWHHPVHRLRKIIFPIIVSCVGVFLLMLAAFNFFPRFVFEQGGQMVIILHTLLAVLLGAGVVITGHLLHQRRQSKFSPIRIRIRRKQQPEQ